MNGKHTVELKLLWLFKVMDKIKVKDHTLETLF